MISPRDDGNVQNRVHVHLIAEHSGGCEQPVQALPHGCQYLVEAPKRDDTPHRTSMKIDAVACIVTRLVPQCGQDMVRALPCSRHACRAVQDGCSKQVGC